MANVEQKINVMLLSLETTSSHVETDVVDENGEYKHYSKYNEIEITLPSDVSIAEIDKLNRNTHLYVDTKEIDLIFKEDPYKAYREVLEKISNKL